MATRRSAPPPAPAAAPVPWPAIGLGAAALAGGLYLLLRPRGASAASGPLITGGQTIGYGDTGGSASTGAAPSALPTPGASNLNPTPSASLITRLQGSDVARQIFALQALLYSASYDDDVPDGIESPTLDAQLVRLNGQAGLTTASPVYSPTSLVNSDNALQGLAGGGLANFGLRSLPFTLPQAVLDQVNASAAALDPSYPSVQATAT